MHKEFFINQLKIDEEFTDFFLVKAIAIRIGSNRKQYLDVTLADNSGEINGKKWDVNDEEAVNLNRIKEGDLVKVRATVNEWNNVKQLRIARIRKGQKEDGCVMTDYIKAAPEDFTWYIPREADWNTTYVNYSLDKDRTKVISESRPYKGRFFFSQPDGGSGAYKTFMGGDLRLTCVKVTTMPNGRRLLLLKDGFGDLLPPFLFYSFEEIHIIDCRYFAGSIREYADRNGITDLLIANDLAHIGMPKIIDAYNQYL